MSSTPDVTVTEVTPADQLLILATDGVWEFVSNQEAVDIVAACATVEDGCRAVSALQAHVCVSVRCRGEFAICV